MAKSSDDDNEPSDEMKRKMAADCFKRGSEAMMKQNWDYAVNMLQKSVKFVPDHLVFRQTLRGCERKKYHDNGTGASMAGMRLMQTKGQIKKARFSSNWKEVERLAESGLEINPWDAQLNFDLGEALRELGYQEVAVFAFEKACESEPKNKDYNKALGFLLEERGDYERAIVCFERVMQLDKLDGASRSKITQLRAQMVMDRGGYEKADSSHEMARKLKQDRTVADGPGISAEADLQRAVRKDPSNKDHYLKLADFYRRAGELAKAEEQLAQACNVSGQDLNIREQLEDVQLDRMKLVVAVARDEMTKSKDDPAAKQKYSELLGEFKHREAEMLARRVERYPQNMQYKLELGKRFFEQKKPQEAIPLFQQARADSRLKGEALLLLGKCFIADKEYTLARRQFKEAIPELNYDDKPDQFKEANYFLGYTCAKLKDKEEAIRAFQEVLAVDYQYRDTKARLMELEGGGAVAS